MGGRDTPEGGGRGELSPLLEQGQGDDPNGGATGGLGAGVGGRLVVGGPGRGWGRVLAAGDVGLAVVAILLGCALVFNGVVQQLLSAGVFG